MKQYTYTIQIHEANPDEKGFWVSVPTLPGCFSRGDTYEEAVANAQEAIVCYIEGLIQDGEPIPEDSQHPAIVTVPVRVPTAI